MNDLYDSVDYTNLKFQYVGPTKDVRLYEYRDSKQIFNAIKGGQIKFSDARNKQNEFLNKLNEVKIGKKTSEKKGVIINTARSYLPTEEVINFYNDYVEM